MRQRARILALFLLVTIGAASPYAHAASLNINCDKQGSIRRALRLLATTNPHGPNTISVSGACRGNFVIQGMDRLTLMTKKGASITDDSNGALAVVDIEDSPKVKLPWFSPALSEAKVNRPESQRAAPTPLHLSEAGRSFIMH
jgi:hypothetical protein